jgi:protein-L-isoaspartate(D-aspartate) O-methyltransferase
LRRKGIRLTMTTSTLTTASATAEARRTMIDSQLRTSGVTDPRVLGAMMRVPREDYVPEGARAAAYSDRAVPLGEGRFLAAPLVHGRMLAEAAPTPQDNALLIGEPEGYLAALLAPLAGSLDTVRPAELAAKRRKGSYSLIVIDGAAEDLPASLSGLLSDDGRLVTGVVERGVSRLAIGRKAAGEIALLPIAELGIPVLAEFAAPRRWSF